MGTVPRALLKFRDEAAVTGAAVEYGSPQPLVQFGRAQA